MFRFRIKTIGTKHFRAVHIKENARFLISLGIVILTITVLITSSIIAKGITGIAMAFAVIATLAGYISLSILSLYIFLLLELYIKVFYVNIVKPLFHK